MNELRIRIYEQKINDSQGGRTSLLNKICGVTIFISIFYTGLLLLISSTFMYLAESSIKPQLLGSIPRCLWWSITTVSAVCNGDLIPVTAVGKLLHL